MRNFPVIIENKTYWISRSIAIAAFLFTTDKDGDLCVLANKRGSGTPDFQGYWSCPCGYLDFDETIEQAIYREVREETGVICPLNLQLYNIDSNPGANHQNVTLQYYAYSVQYFNVKPEGGEENEVSEVKWIKIKDLNNYKWAFSHNKIILNIINLIKK